ncbi:MAG TPA: phage tail sheath C-terminal domain-containing protein [Ohtaekwangia sp.]|uniref:phage tail sheath C-terminal domain-containing protein n=1 Tax=Ohtaekwangia sp. TaxID=2066019 RepID=UPI002F9295FB
MATVYKTPGVFVEEIPKFPPSVAQVETALPAFVGYTEKATNIADNDLKLKARRIGSMVEYEQYFGYGPKTIVTSVSIDDKNNFKSADAKSQYYMYDSLRLFFSNGGGDCFIVSIGLYKTNLGVPVEGDFTKGIDALLTEDDPTIVLFPDAVLMDDTSLGNVQKAALTHCADESRRDRVAVFDLAKNDTKPSELGKTFKQNIGVNNLSYGMAYTPWLKVNIPKNVTYADIVGKLLKNGAAVTLDALIPADDPNKVDLTKAIDQVGKVYTDINNINAQTTALSGIFGSLSENFGDLVNKYNAAPSVAKFTDLINYLRGIFLAIDDTLDPAIANRIQNDSLKASVQAAVNSDFKALFSGLIAIDKEAADDTLVKVEYPTALIKQADITNAVWGATFVNDVLKSGFMTAATKEEKVNQAVAELQKLFGSINRAYYLFLVDGAASAAQTQNSGLENSLPVFKSIIRGVSTSISELPPSGAIAGVYATVDRTRGVWKAPANVSLNNVVEPTQVYTKTQLDNLNVDVNAGKSINAIRTFFGKGTLVYGSRTLAGNDNEWRYIPVRRLFIMVEESVKKATEQFVFEPNDANTWVKVQAMIENFLFVIWRQGALQGAKPEHAFYVAVGLNKTMTPLDILEGRMIVEIGLAAVRPAEFIILRFSHKMAES